MRTIILASMAMITAIGCRDEPPPTASASGLVQTDDRRARAERAARIAREVLENPGRGSAVLTNYEISPEEFSDMMYEIAGDPELAEVYETVRG